MKIDDLLIANYDRIRHLMCEYEWKLCEYFSEISVILISFLMFISFDK